MELYFPCPLCGKAQQIKKSKKGRPYILCPEDQAWFFVNGEEGIKKLKSKAFEKKPGWL